MNLRLPFAVKYLLVVALVFIGGWAVSLTLISSIAWL